jgi:hypothetical protein
MAASAGTSQVIIRSPAGTGNRYFRIVRNATIEMSPSSGCIGGQDSDVSALAGSQITAANTGQCSNGAWYINVTNASWRYVFKTPSANATSFYWWAIQGTERTVSSVFQNAVIDGSATTITANLSGTLSTGQAVYLRYSTNAFSTSTVVQMTPSGSTATADIPAGTNVAGNTVSYYVFTGPSSGVAADGSNADLLTFNLNNNSGSNYSYTVGAFGDAFNRSSVNPGNNPSFTYTSALGTGVTSAINGNTFLEIASTTSNAVSYVTGSTSSFGNGYNTTLSSNSAALITWTFNMRWNRSTSNPAPPFNGQYGQATVLAGSSATLTGGNGYAVVYGSTGTPDPVRLVRYTGGLFNSTGGTFTDICTSAANDLSATNNYISVRVTYAPSTNTWSLFVRDDGASAWVDPSSGVTAQKGTSTVDNTYTSTSLTAFGFVWTNATTAASGQWDNFRCAIAAAVAPSVTSFSVAAPGSGTSGYVGNTITVTGSGFTGTTIVRVGGSGGTAVGSFTVANDNTITFPAIAASGTIYVQNSAGNSTSASSYTNLGYITTTTGTWQTAATWLGNAVPPSATTTDVTIAHNVTGTTGTTIVRNLTVNSTITLTNTAGATIDINGASTNSGTITNNGTISVTGVTYTNSGTFNIGNGGTFQINQGGFLAGTALSYNATASTLVFNNSSGQYGVQNTHAYWPASNGPITVTAQGAGGVQLQTGATRTITNLNLSAGFDIQAAGLLTVNGNLTINTGGGITSNAPIYGSASFLIYNTTSNPYNVATEWTGNGTTAGTGIPQNVTIQSSNNVSMPNSNRGLAGNLLIQGTATFTLNATSGDIYVAGNFTNSSNFNNNGRAVFMNGSAAQTISGSFATGTGTTNNFSYLVLNNSSGGVSLTSAAQVVATAGSPLQLLGAGNFNINNVTLTMPNAGGNIQVTGGTRVINFVTASSFLNITNTKTVTSTSGGLLSFTSAASGAAVQISAGVDFGAGLTTIGNLVTLMVNAGGFVNTNPVTYATGSTLSFRTGATYTVGSTDKTWGPGTSGAGVPFNVDITTNAATNVVISDDRTARNIVTLNTGTLTNNTNVLNISTTNTTGANALAIVGGTLSNGGGTINIGPSGGGNQSLSLTSGAFTLTAGTVNINGGIAHSGGTFTMSGTPALNIDPNSGTLASSIGSGTIVWSITGGTQAVSGGTITIVDNPNAGSAKTIEYNLISTNASWVGSTLILGGSSGTNGTTATAGFALDSYAGTGRLTFGNVTVNGGNITDRYTAGPSATGNEVIVGGTLTINTGSELRIGTSDEFYLRGNLVNNGTLTSLNTAAPTSSTGALHFSQSSAGTANTLAQSITGSGIFRNATSSPTASFQGLEVNNTASGAALDFSGYTQSLSTSVGTLLTAGAVLLANNQDFTYTGTTPTNLPSGAGGYFITTGSGFVKKAFATGASNFLFRVGDNNGTFEYSPITIALSANSNARTLGVRAVDLKQSQMDIPNAAVDYLSRYWSTFDSGSGSLTGTAAMTYIVATDVNGTEGLIKAAYYDGANWTQATGSITSPVLTSSSLTLNSLNALDFTGRNNPGTPYTWNGSVSADWANASNWTPNGIPTSIDNATIVTVSGPNQNLNLTSAQSINNLIINGNFAIAATGSLSVGGAVTYTSGTVTMDCASTFSYTAAVNVTIAPLNYGNLNASGGARTLSATGTIGVCGTYTPGTSTTTTNSTFNYNGTGAQTITAATYNNLTISNNRGAANLTLGSGTITIAGVFDPSGFSTTGSVIVGTGTVDFSSASAQTIPAFFYNNITNTGNGARTFQNSGTIDIAGTFTTGSGTYTSTGSTVRYSNQTSTAFNMLTFTAVGGKQYNNLIFAGANGLTIFDPGGNTINLSGNLTVQSGTLRMSSSTYGAGTINVDGNILISGGTLNTSGNSGTGTIRLKGDFTVQSGSVQRSTGSASITFNSPNASPVQNFTQSGGTINGTTTWNIGVVASTSVNTVKLGSNLDLGNGVVQVNNGATLDFSTYVLSGTSGTFTQNSGGGIATANANGVAASGASGSIQSTGTRTFSTSGNFTYYSNASQSFGTGFPATVNNLTINNTSGSDPAMTLGQAETVNGILTLTAGAVQISNDVTVTSSSPSSVASSGGYLQTTGTSRLLRSIATGANTYLYPVGLSLNFTPANYAFSANNTAFTLGVNSTSGTHPNMNSNGTQTDFVANRFWTTSTVGTTGTYAYTATYTTATGDFQGTAANIKLNKWNGTLWTEDAGSSVSGLNIVSGSLNESTGNLTATSQWTGRVNPSIVNYIWVGTNGNSWTDGGNWNPNGVPTSQDNVTISSPGLNGLILSGALSVNDFNVTGTGNFTADNTAVLTINGNIVSTTSAAVSLCGSTINISSSSPQTIPAWGFGNLNATGGNRTLVSTGTIGICGTFTRGAGTYTITGSTVDFNGAGAQTIAAGTYNNLTISNNRGAAAITLPAGTIDIAGVFSPTATNYSVVNTGNTINYSGGAGQTIAAFSYNNLTSANSNRTLANAGVVAVAGTFTPGTGTYTTTSSTVNFNGAANQTVPVIPYNNLIVSGNPSAVTAVKTMAGALTLAGNFTLDGSAVTSGGIVEFRQNTGAGLNDINVSGNTSINAGAQWTLTTGTGSATGPNANITGTFTMTGGTVNFNSNTAGSSNYGGNLYIQGDVNVSGGTFTSTGVNALSRAGYFSTNKAGTQNLTFTPAALSGYGYVFVAGPSTTVLQSNIATVANWGVLVSGDLDFGSSNVVSGGGVFTTNAQGGLIIANPGGVNGAITVTGTKTFDATTWYTFNGTNQNTGFPAAASTCDQFNWAGSGTLTLNKSFAVNGTAGTQCNISTNGLIILGSGINLTLGANTSLLGTFSANRMFVANGGQLIRSYTSPFSLPFTYPIGDNSGTAEYSPVTINSISSALNGSIGFSVTDAVHPSNGAAVDYLTRYWSTSTTFSSYSWTGSFTYVTGDIVGSESNLKLNIWDNSSSGWTEYPSSSAASNVLTVTAGPGTGSLANTDLTGRKDVPLYYRSAAAGPNIWNSAASWEVATDVAFTSPSAATLVPNATNSAGIFIRTGHTINATTSVTADDLDITGTLNVSNTFIMANGTAATDVNINTGGSIISTGSSAAITLQSGAAITSSGLIRVTSSSASLNSFGTINMNNGSEYNHDIIAGTIPTCIWNSGSLCNITGITATAPGGLGQNFFNLTWNCSQSQAIGLANAITGPIQNDFTVANTGGQDLRLASTQTVSLTIGRDLLVTGGILIVHGGSPSFVVPSSVLTITRDLKISNAGTFQITNTYASGSNIPVVNVGRNVQNTGTTGLRLVISGSNLATTPSQATMNVTGSFTHDGTGTTLITNGTGAGNLNVGGGFYQSAGTISNPGSSTGVVTFNSASASQDFQQTAGAISGNINWNIGTGSSTNTVQMLSNVNLGTGTGTLNVRSGSTMDFRANVLSGSGTFSMNSTNATIKIGSAQGIAASGATGNVQTTTRSFASDGYYIYSGQVNQITGSGLPTTPRLLTIANTGASSNNIVTLSQNTGNLNNSTPAYFLVLQSGLLNLNTFNISLNNVGVQSTGGDFVTSGVTGAVVGNGGTVVMNGTLNFPNVSMVSSQIDFGSASTIWGNFTVSGGNILPAGSAPTYASGSTLIYNVGYGTYKEWTAGTTGVGVPWNVQVNGGFTLDMSANTGNRLARGNFAISGTVNLTNGSNQAGTTTVNGNLTMNSGGTMNMGSCPNALTVGGNMTNAGTLTLSSANGGDIYVGGNWNSTGTLNFNSRAVFFNGSGSQTIQTAHTFPFMLITNSGAGTVTLGAATAIGSTLTLTTGKLILSSFNLTMNPGATISGGSSACYVQTNSTGRLIQTVGASNVNFPVGNTAYNPISLANSGVSDTYGVIAKDGASGNELDASKIVLRNWDVTEGVAGGSNLTVNLNWNAPVAQTGEEAVNFVRGASQKYIGLYNAGWTTQNATLSGSNPYQYSASGFATVGTFEAGIQDAFRPVPVISTATPTSVYTGDVITISGSNLNTVSTVTLGGVAMSITSQNATTIQAVVNAGSSGSLVVTNPAGTATIAGFTYLGYISDNNSDWNTGSTWRGGNVPPAGAIVTINSDVAVGSTVAATPSTITVNSTRTLSFGSSGTLGVSTSLTNNGTVDMSSGGTFNLATGNTLTNNGVFTGGSGTVVAAGAMTLNGATAATLNNLTLNGGATLTSVPTINGILLLNNGAFVSAAPNYGSVSTLQYNTGTTYGRNVEWSATTGAGYPANVRVSGSTTLNLGNGGAATARQMSGNLQIDNGSSLNMNTTPMTAALTVLGNVSIDGTLVLSGSVGGDINVKGDWTRSATGTFTPNSRAVLLTGTGNQSITGPGSNTFPFLIINKASGVVNMNNDINVSSVLTFATGNTAYVNAGSFTLTVSSNLTTAIDRQTGAAGHVVGNLRRGIAAGSNTFLFPVGSTAAYTPASISINGAINGAGQLMVSTTSTDHPQLATSGIDASKSVNRYWTLTATSLSLTNYSAVLNFVSGDVDAGANTANFLIQRYSSGWNNQTVGTLTATSSQITGATAWGDLAIGECRTPNVYSVIGGGSYCSGGSGVSVGLSGSDTWATYQLRLNGADVGSPIAGTGGVISFGNQTAAGTYSVVATTVGGSCSQVQSGSVLISIDPQLTPAVSITVSPSTTVCTASTVTFTASPSNGGASPSYVWRKNGSIVGTNSPTYSYNAPVTGDQIYVVMTTSATCVSSSTATSNTITITVTAPTLWYQDSDGDGYGSLITINNCGQPAGYVAIGGDCNDSNADINPGMDEICNGIDDNCNGQTDEGLALAYYFQDLDGDGYGNAGVNVLTCAAPAGYVTNNTDCNDNCASCYPGATEIADGFDNNCNGLVDEGFGPANDLRSTGLFAVLSNYFGNGSNCSTVSGTLLGATASSEALTGSAQGVVTGQDVWYYFTATQPGVSIKVNSAVNNIAIELQTQTGTLVAWENYQSGIGNEVLNYAGLTVGQTYYIAVRNANSAQGVGGPFTLCVNMLQRGACGSASGNFDLCGSLQANFSYASNYVFRFTDVLNSNLYTFTASSTYLVLAQVQGLLPGRTYSLRVDASYNLQRGDGSTQVLVIPGTTTCNININAHTPMYLNTLSACPNNKLMSGNITIEPWICAAVDYEVRFEKTSGPQLPITYFRGSTNRLILLNQVPGLTTGTYNVFIRPRFASGTPGVTLPGTFNTTPSCMVIIGPAMAERDPGNAFLKPDEKILISENEEEADIAVYPNPSDGTAGLQLFAKGMNGVAQVSVINTEGQKVYNSNVSLSPETTSVVSPSGSLPSGLYTVLITMNNQTFKRKWLVVR